MKRKLAWLGAILSGLYLLTMGPIPDPLPFIDEAFALGVLLKCAAYLGYDLRNWLPFFSKQEKSRPPRKSKDPKDVPIDV